MADKVKHNVAYGCCGNEGCVGGLPTGTWQVTRCQCEAPKPIQIPILECVGVAHLSQNPCPSCGKNVDTYKPSTEWIAKAAKEAAEEIKPTHDYGTDGGHDPDCVQCSTKQKIQSAIERNVR